MRVGVLHRFFCLSQPLLHAVRYQRLCRKTCNGQHNAQTNLHRHRGNRQQLRQYNARRNTQQAGCNQIRRHAEQCTGHTEQHKACQQNEHQSAVNDLSHERARHISNQRTEHAARQEYANVCHTIRDDTEHNAQHQHRRGGPRQSAIGNAQRTEHARQANAQTHAGYRAIQCTDPAHNPAPREAQNSQHKQQQQLCQRAFVQRSSCLQCDFKCTVYANIHSSSNLFIFILIPCSVSTGTHHLQCQPLYSVDIPAV